MPGQSSGFVCTVDPSEKRVLGRCPIIEPPLIHADPNPRGGMRGAKGIAVFEGTVFFANHSSVFQFDAEWKPIREITHPSCASIHDIVYGDDGMWVTSSRNDLVLALDLAGHILRHINLRAIPEVRHTFGWIEPNLLRDEDILAGTIDFRDPRCPRYETSDGAHVNSIAFLPTGDLLVMMGFIQPRSIAGAHDAIANAPMNLNPATGTSAIVRLRADGPVEFPVILNNADTPTHSLMVEADATVLFDDTRTGEVVRLHPETGRETLRLKATEKFLRGICRISDDVVVVGTQEGLTFLDLPRERIIGAMALSANPNESVYDIKVLPEHFGPLPSQLKHP